MDEPYLPPSCRITLNEILELQDQPVSEEQAWALCYQLAAVLSQSHQDTCGPHHLLRLHGVHGVQLSSDGNVYIKVEHADRDEYFTFDTEDKIVDYLGRLIYYCLDWGLGTNVERDLDESLEALVCQMTKLNITQAMEDSLQSVCSLAEVIQACEDRLYDPAQATQHYRAVCSTLFSETVEICRCLQKIQHTKQSLERLVVEPETRIVSPVTTNWAYVWKHLVEELKKGVKLRPKGERLNMSAPLPLECSPFKNMLKDIQQQRFKLRKVQSICLSHKWKDPRDALLEYVRSRPKLRPASERKLKTRPKEEVSLHEKLMKEIRMVNQQKLLSSHKRRLPCNDSFLLNTIPVADFQLDCEEDLQDNINSQHTSSTLAAEQDLKFFPALSSSPMDPHFGCSRSKQRSRSLTSHLRLASVGQNKWGVPSSISEVLRMRRVEMGVVNTISCNRYSSWRVCSCCSKRSMYFTWHNSCSLCNRVICPECCIEMRVPFKWCMNLPVSFFKKIILDDPSDKERSRFWRERWSWDCSRVPLVLESHGTFSTPMHTLAMRDWYRQDICTDCKIYLLKACDSVFSLGTVTSTQEV